jgi:hypothetical protein
MSAVSSNSYASPGRYVERQNESTPTAQENSTCRAEDLNKPPFAEYLDLVSFVAVITICSSLSASQTFAITSTFLGYALNTTASGADAQSALAKNALSATYNDLQGHLFTCTKGL